MNLANIVTAQQVRNVNPADAPQKRSDDRALQQIRSIQALNGAEQGRQTSRRVIEQEQQQLQQGLQGRLFTVGQRSESSNPEEIRQNRLQQVRDKLSQAYSAPSPDYQGQRVERSMNASAGNIDYLV